MDVGKISEQEICQHSAAGALLLHIQMQQEEGAISGKGVAVIFQRQQRW